MSALALNYDGLTRISSYADKLANKADEYADRLTTKVVNKVDYVTGGTNDILSSAKYYVKAKVTELHEKREAYQTLSRNIANLVSNAKQIDKEVANAIAHNKESFLKSNSHLKIDDWKANIINWLVDLKNKCPVFEVIGNAVNFIGTELSSIGDNIRYWYRCEGGKEKLEIVWALGAAAVSALLFLASFPISSFVAFCAMIGALITAANSIYNVYTSFRAAAVANTDPAWAKIYGDRNTIQDGLRQRRFSTKFMNKLSYISANMIDGVKLFCSVVAIGSAIKKVKLKFKPLQNYLTSNRGLLSYFKELKYSSDGKVIADDKGIAETRYTLRSVWRGIKAFVNNSPIDCRSDLGIRTLLHQNFVADWKGFISSFSFTGIKDTIRYNIEYGYKWTAIMFNKNADFVTIIKDTWSLKDTADIVKKIKGFGQFVEQITTGSYDINKKLAEKVYNYSDLVSILNKIGVTKIIGDKLNWKYAPSGVIQDYKKLEEQPLWTTTVKIVNMLRPNEIPYNLVKFAFDAINKEKIATKQGGYNVLLYQQ